MTDEWKQRQQIMRRIFEGVLPTAEERNKYHISNTDVRALEQFVPVYKEYFRSEIDDLECDFDNLEYNYALLKEENENNKKMMLSFRKNSEKLKEDIVSLEANRRHFEYELELFLTPNNKLS